jgi:hypothetical protein
LRHQHDEGAAEDDYVLNSGGGSLFSANEATITRMTMLVLALSIAGWLVPQSASSQPVARSADVASMDEIVAALYDVISGPAGQARDWDRMRSLFVPGNRLIPSVAGEHGGATARVLDVEGYIERVRPTFERNGFFEREIARKTEAFGNIAHVFSTYESRHTASDAAPFARAINRCRVACSHYLLSCVGLTLALMPPHCTGTKSEVCGSR